MKRDRGFEKVARERRAFLAQAAKAALGTAGVVVLATAKPKEAQARPYGWRKPRPPRFRSW